MSAIDERREVIHALRERDDVVTVDFTRDGFHTVYVHVEPGTDDLGAAGATARDLGYRVERMIPAVFRLTLNEGRP